jgi:hypothetical protein
MEVVMGLSNTDRRFGNLHAHQHLSWAEQSIEFSLQ